jgi:hypothetical protein
MRCEACAYPVEGLPFKDYGLYVLCYACDVNRPKLVELGIIPRSAWDDEDDHGFPVRALTKASA